MSITAPIASESSFTHLHFVMVFVRDQEQSLRFYQAKLGFKIMIDTRLESGQRWLELSPPDGPARVALVKPPPGSEEEQFIGRFTGILFLTDDVLRTFAEWQSRGVHFLSPPQHPALGVMATRFEDPDGNSFALAGIDEVSREIEARRRAVVEKAEAARRTAQELEIAKQVQSRLFPQLLPDRPALDYYGLCVQARQVGGDYYDFLDLGSQRLGIVLADISGKGIGAALLMASLQASLRSQFAGQGNDPRLLLQSANRIFYQSSPEASYATLFFADYEEQRSRLTYINCGHLAALLLKSDGTYEWLESTATVLGLFKEWDCLSETRHFASGDIFVLYTDGVTETADQNDQEFGRERVLALVQAHSTLPAQAIVAAIVEQVTTFSAGDQHDDITVIVAKHRPQLGPASPAQPSKQPPCQPPAQADRTRSAKVRHLAGPSFSSPPRAGHMPITAVSRKSFPIS